MQVNLKARAEAAEHRRTRTSGRLMEAAMRVIADRGPEAASVSEIAGEAGVSRGLFYNYFPTLEELVQAVSQRMTEELDLELLAAVREVTDPAERIGRACQAFIEKGLSDPVWGWVRLRLDASQAGAPQLVMHRFLDLFGQAVASGRLKPAEPLAALSLATGAVRMAVRVGLTTENAPADLPRQTAVLILTGLGLERDEAEATMAPRRL